ncbi:MAG: hypothetical protein LLG02_07755 [Pelosinus sp.]|nr:hypothetical protein [Pelosinus sp.]
MKRFRDRKPMPIDFDHMRMLHQECIEQLELMATALEAVEYATDSIRDALDDMSLNHWSAYLDLIHMICMHDEAMEAALKQHGMPGSETSLAENERQFGSRRVLLRLLLPALTRRHRRIDHIFGRPSSPMAEYMKESLAMEREHIAKLVSIIQSFM